MRWVAVLPKPVGTIRRLILHDVGDSAYVYPSEYIDDRGGIGDEWYESVELARAVCRDHYGASEATWQPVPDPLPGCLNDFIAPVRVSNRAENPRWQDVRFERLEDGAWLPYDPKRNG